MRSHPTNRNNGGSKTSAAKDFQYSVPEMKFILFFVSSEYTTAIIHMKRNIFILSAEYLFQKVNLSGSPMPDLSSALSDCQTETRKTATKKISAVERMTCISFDFFILVFTFNGVRP